MDFPLVVAGRLQESDCDCRMSASEALGLLIVNLLNMYGRTLPEVVPKDASGSLCIMLHTVILLISTNQLSHSHCRLEPWANSLYSQHTHDIQSPACHVSLSGVDC